MIGFDYLGKMGQLGNQMFQYASLKGIANNNGHEYCVPNHNELIVDVLGNRLRIELFEPFTMNGCNNNSVIGNGYVQEEGFTFNENIFNSCPDNISLVGYFQSEKYFKHIEEEVRKDFSFIDNIKTPCEEMIQSVSNPIALHIRRGDFLRNSGNHYNLDLDYYARALSLFDIRRNVAIFTDDPEWCRQQDIFDHDRFLIATGNTSYVDLCLMSLCSDFIIANSTYSWWGAWLANRGRVIAPSKWFGPNNKHLDTKDLYPKQWEIIDA